MLKAENLYSILYKIIRIQTTRIQMSWLTTPSNRPKILTPIIFMWCMPKGLQDPSNWSQILASRNQQIKRSWKTIKISRTRDNLICKILEAWPIPIWAKLSKKRAQSSISRSNKSNHWNDVWKISSTTRSLSRSRRRRLKIRNWQS